MKSITNTVINQIRDFQDAVVAIERDIALKREMKLKLSLVALADS